jgi:hypothetical protein
MGVLRQAIEEQRERADAVALGRLALSKREAADALGVSVDFLEEHVMHELRDSSNGLKAAAVPRSRPRQRLSHFLVWHTLVQS